MDIVPDYSRARLLRAIHIISSAKAFDNEQQLLKEIENTYREPINTRGGRRVQRVADLAYASDDNDDESYDPTAGRKLVVVKKRLTAHTKPSEGNVTHCHTPKRKKGIEGLPPTQYDPFITLVLSSAVGKDLLKSLANLYQTDVKQESRRNSGHSTSISDTSPGSSSGSTLATDYEESTLWPLSYQTSGQPQCKVEGQPPAPRRLRSGKVIIDPVTTSRRERPAKPATFFDCASIPNSQNNDVTLTRHDAILPSARLLPAKRNIAIEDNIPTKRIKLRPDETCHSLSSEDMLNRMLDEGTDPVKIQAFLREREMSDISTTIRKGLTESTSNRKQSATNRVVIDLTISPDPVTCPIFEPNNPYRVTALPSVIPESAPQIKHKTKPESADKTIDLVTAFAHPINFKSQNGCSFCKDYRFGLLGHGFKEVKVVRLATDSSKYLELGGGHAEYHPATKMCVLCAIARLTIIHCSSHILERRTGLAKTSTAELNETPRTVKQVSISSNGNSPQPIQGTNRTIQDENRDKLSAATTAPMIINQHQTTLCPTGSATTQHSSSTPSPMSPNPPRLTPTQPSTHQTPCTLCLSPATHLCTTYQTHNALKQPCFIPPNLVSYTPTQQAKAFENQQNLARKKYGGGVKLQPSIRGCGLHLCRTCTEIVKKSGGGLDEKVLRKLRFKEGSSEDDDCGKKGKIGGVYLGMPRADFEFLFETGLLWKAYHGDSTRQEVSRRWGRR